MCVMSREVYEKIVYKRSYKIILRISQTRSRNQPRINSVV